jgi:hypothetical protein
MKKRNWSLPLFISVKVMLVIILITSCSKKDDTPAPADIVDTTNGNKQSSTLCNADSICHLPYRIMAGFIPSGFYNSGDLTTTLTFDSIGETPKYANEGLRIVYTCSGGWGWGAHFLNNDNWSGVFKVSPKAKKITFYVRTDYSANVTFNAFGDVQYGKVELYETTPVANPVWEKITIDLLGKPATFNAPLNIVIDGVANGDVTVVDIKDVLIE